LQRQTTKREKNTGNLPYSDEDMHYGMNPRFITQATSVPFHKRLFTTDKNCGQSAKTKKQYSNLTVETHYIQKQ
jgi:hypothetical protein